MIELGRTVVDRISGFTGKATGRAVFLDKVYKYLHSYIMVDPDPDNDNVGVEWIDETQLDYVEAES